MKNFRKLAYAKIKRNLEYRSACVFGISFLCVGGISVGGKFAGSFNLLILSLLCLSGIVISLFIKPKKYERFRKIQLTMCIILTIMIIAAVLILERQFPSAEYVYS